MSDLGETEGLGIIFWKPGLGPKMASIEKSEYMMMMMTLWSNFRNWWGSDLDPSYLYSSWLVRSACRPARFLFYASSSTVLVSIQNLDGNFYQWVSREESSPLIWTVHRDSRSFLAINRINGRSGSINWRKSGSLAWDEKIQFILISSLAEQRFLRLLKKDFLCYTIYWILMCERLNRNCKIILQ